jgi:hypothetical protein
MWKTFRSLCWNETMMGTTWIESTVVVVEGRTETFLSPLRSSVLPSTPPWSPVETEARWIVEGDPFGFRFREERYARAFAKPGQLVHQIQVPATEPAHEFEFDLWSSS